MREVDSFCSPLPLLQADQNQLVVGTFDQLIQEVVSCRDVEKLGHSVAKMLQDISYKAV